MIAQTQDSPMVKSPPIPTKDRRDWYVVTDQGCSECGFSPGGLAPAAAAAQLRWNLPLWESVLEEDIAERRPDETIWSAIEYACHVRDLCQLIPGRLRAMMSFNDARFEDWDQGRAAVEGKYWAVNADVASRELSYWLTVAAEVLERVPASQWRRTGIRDDGACFTIVTLCANLAHEVHHHLRDAQHSR